jgi:SAM-dependent methyltransferase
MPDLFTQTYYEENAQTVFERTLMGSPSPEKFHLFLERITPGGHILDAGCASGRDSRFFLEQGYRVTAIDASAALCKLAEGYLGQPVLCQRFEELVFENNFDGIWASHSLLHVSRLDFPDVIQRLYRALKPGGVLYATFYHGNGELRRGNIFFNDYDENSFGVMLATCSKFTPVRFWQSQGFRPGQIVFHALAQKEFSPDTRSTSSR